MFTNDRGPHLKGVIGGVTKKVFVRQDRILPAFFPDRNLRVRSAPGATAEVCTCAGEQARYVDGGDSEARVG